MSAPIHFTVQPEETDFSFVPKMVALAGFTGRDPAAVRMHIEELQRIGIETPAKWPVVYAVTPDRLTVNERIEVLHPETSGEVEFVVILTGGQTYIGIGSDHTDRRNERLDIGVAKQLVPRVLGRNVWRYEDIRSHWDSLELRSYVLENGRPRLYQKGPVAGLLPVEGIIECVASRSSKPLEDAVIFGGTVPVLGENVSYAPHFIVEMFDPRRDRTLRAEYDVVVSDWVITD